jgi:di/tricarboxylate transporter
VRTPCCARAIRLSLRQSGRYPKIKDTAGVEIVADVHVSDSDLAGENTALVEAVLLPGSPLLGRTLRRQRFRERYGAQVLGINHQGANVIEKLRDVPLRLGDLVLLQGARDNLAHLHESRVVHVLGASESMQDVRPRIGRAPLAIGIFVGVLAVVIAGVLKLPLTVNARSAASLYHPAASLPKRLMHASSGKRSPL